MSSHPQRGAPAAELVGIAMLLWALVPINPYGYYVLLRFAICGIAVYLAIRAHELEKTFWVWMLAITAIVYNPLVPVHLNREIWSAVNIATIALFACSIYILRPKATKDLRQVESDKPQAS